MLIQTSSIGLLRLSSGVYLASEELNNWCQGDCDFSLQPKLIPSSDQAHFELDGSTLLRPSQEFKLIIPYLGAEQAAQLYAARMDAQRKTYDSIHVDRRFDYDTHTGHFWLLATSHPVVRKGSWNQNNIYRGVLPLQQYEVS